MTEVVAEVAASAILLPDGWHGPGVVEIDDTGSIRAVRATASAVPDVVLAPGFVDLQVNGVDDVDVASATGADWDRLDEALLDHGVTTWCPTLVTAPRHHYDAALARIAAAAARPGTARPAIAGAHLEGPFLGGAPGAHPRHLLAPIDLDWLGALPAIVRLVTLAPELPLAASATRLLTERGVIVSLGHSTPQPEHVEACVAAGATMATHLFNAMSGVHHRDPGLAAMVLADERLVAGLIADGVHVDPLVIRLAFRAKPGRVALVSDAVAWRAGRLGELGIDVRDGAPRLPDGTLAGSALTMDQAVRTCVQRAGVALADALAAASTVPAAVAGLADRGVIEPGRRADLVALTPDLAIAGVWVTGRQVR
jgi:N-acetylglucosamine-6-phosphate deacetylase